jgi:hypothetical protein
MSRKIDWNKKAVKLLSKFVPEYRMDLFDWYTDRETETEYILSWVDSGRKQQFIVNKETLAVVFVK